MFERVIQMVGLDDISDRTKMHDMSAIRTIFLDNDPNGAPCVRDWNHCSVVVALSYLQSIVRPDMNFAVQ